MEVGDISHADHNILSVLRRVGGIKEDKEANWPSVHVRVVSRSGYKIKYVVDISKIKKKKRLIKFYTSFKKTHSEKSTIFMDVVVNQRYHNSNITEILLKGP